MAKRIIGKSYSIRHYVKIMFVILVSVLILDCMISFAAISIVKQQSTRYLQDTANMYMNQIDHDFAYIKHYMGWTLANDASIKTMNRFRPVDSEFLKANNDLYKRFSELQRNYGQEYNFFVYLKNQQYFMNAAPTTLNYSNYVELKKQIFSYAQDKNLFGKFYSNWSLILIKDKYYTINIVPYYDSYLICLISANDLIRPLQQLNLGENGLVSLVDQNGDELLYPESDEVTPIHKDAGASSLLKLAKQRTIISEKFSNATFGVKLLIRFGTFEKIMIAQLLIMLLAVIVACSLCGVMLYFNILILRPIKNFSFNLTQFNEDSKPLDIKMNKIVELEHANKLFKNLLEQIKIFKIDIYERELEKQRIQLDYMKLQIKPHFFLNCLTNIYSMAQMQMFEEIQSMAISTSNYFRYIFQNGQDFVKLSDEIDHVRIYLEIQKHRYRDAFSYRFEQAEGMDNMKIPPLVLQTFIENSVKYAVSRVSEVHIHLAAERMLEADEELAVIRISDTGPGFADEILKKLVSGQPLDQSMGNHIGIMNTLERLELLYRHKAKVTFSNSENGGACVTIYLPHPPRESV